MKCVHWRSPQGNPHPGMPWCKTSNIKAVDQDDIITADECRVTCKACKNFLTLGSRLRGAVAAEGRASVLAISAKADAVRSMLNETMEPEVTTPRVDWFGEG